MDNASQSTFWQSAWKQFCCHRLGVIALIIVFIFILVGIYAPFLASSKPIIVQFNGEWYFPLFRYLFYTHFFTKPLDIFYNLLIFTFPLFALAWIGLSRFPLFRFWSLIGIAFLQIALFLILIIHPIEDPAFDYSLNRERQEELQEQILNLQTSPLLSSPVLPSWNRELESMNSYGQLNLVLRYQQYLRQRERLQEHEKAYHEHANKRNQSNSLFPTLWNLTYQQDANERESQFQVLEELKDQYPPALATMKFIQHICHPEPNSFSLASRLGLCNLLNHLSPEDRSYLFHAKGIVDRYARAEARINYIKEKHAWLESQAAQLHHEVMPLLRPYHWEDDAGGDQGFNRFVDWWDLTRINRKDMVASLVFGVRISLSVGLLAIGLALLIGIPIGALAGYYGGKLDLIAYRLIEIWESMPTFFMLLMIVAFFESKSIFLIIGVIGLFGWTRFSRFIRGEFFRQKKLLYVEACQALGYPDRKIIFSHLLPNAIPPLLTLIPFAIMGAITTEAALSFLGLGEEGSNSWGVLMDEGRSAFPSESYLLWPPAILLTILLVSIALVGDHLRDALDPKLHIKGQ